MPIIDWINYSFSGSKSLIKLAPFLLNKLIYKDYQENRPALYPSSYSDSFNSFFSECTHIIDNIYLGSSYNASNYDLLKEKNIRKIVNVSDNVPNFYNNDIEYYYYEIKDNGIEIFDKKDLDNIIKFIKCDKNILVHCVVGRSRSATIVIYYLMKEKNSILKI